MILLRLSRRLRARKEEEGGREGEREGSTHVCVVLLVVGEDR